MAALEAVVSDVVVLLTTSCYLKVHYIEETAISVFAPGVQTKLYSEPGLRSIYSIYCPQVYKEQLTVMLFL